ncbi:MAG TPA: hypothetical protein VFI41_12800 [Gemmatimonadales bacterium]|nr:hypothetical protein [Gemmatimonadales bacterium]
MIATRLYPSGAWEVSDIIGDRHVRSTYYGYTRREALALFAEEHDGLYLAAVDDEIDAAEASATDSLLDGGAP